MYILKKKHFKNQKIDAQIFWPITQNFRQIFHYGIQKRFTKWSKVQTHRKNGFHWAILQMCPPQKYTCTFSNELPHCFYHTLATELWLILRLLFLFYNKQSFTLLVSVVTFGCSLGLLFRDKSLKCLKSKWLNTFCYQPFFNTVQWLTLLWCPLPI